MAMTHTEQLKYINTLPRTIEWSNKISISKTKPKIEITCKYCGKIFYVIPSKKYTKYCSKECKHSDNTKTLICLQCGKEFETYKSDVDRKYCCIDCRNKSKINSIPWNKNTKGLMPIPHNKGKHLSEETKKKLKLSHLGKPGYWKDKIKNPCSEEIKRKISISNGGNGISDRTNKRYYHKLDNEYKNWRKQVFERDNYTCQLCKKRSSKNNKIYIEPHHIYGWSLYPELRYEIKNGITLCKDCHRLIHK